MSEQRQGAGGCVISDATIHSGHSLSLSLPVMHRTSLVSIVVHGRLLWAQPEALDKGAVEQAIKTIVDHDSDARDVHKTQG